MNGSQINEFEQAFVSVLIVNWNTREHLERCLESLVRGHKPQRSEVIVIDNASSDGSAEMVARHYPEFLLVKNEMNVGFARAVNQAAKLARGDLLLFLNSDTILEKNTIATCRDFLLAHEDVAVVGCKIKFPDGSLQSSTFRFPSLRGILLTSLWLSQAFPNNFVLNWDRYGNSEWIEPQDVDVTMGSFFLLRRSAIENAAPLDEGYFMYGEECDLCRKLLSQGWRTMHLPYASLTHVRGGSTKTSEMEGWAAEAKSRGHLRYLWKWRSMTIAWIANLIMLLGLPPRLLVWGFSDFLLGLKSGKLRVRKLFKGRVFVFHIMVIFKPKTIQQNWSGPDAIRADHR